MNQAEALPGTLQCHNQLDYMHHCYYQQHTAYLCLESILKQPQRHSKAHNPSRQLSCLRVPSQNRPRLLPGCLGFSPPAGFSPRTAGPCRRCCCRAATTGRAASTANAATATAAAAAVVVRQAIRTSTSAAAAAADAADAAVYWLQRGWPSLLLLLLLSAVAVVGMHDATASTGYECRSCC
jgi:hypothetical protein